MMKNQFDIQAMVLVGDRGMITKKLIDEELREATGIDWITGLMSTLMTNKKLPRPLLKGQ